MASAFITTQDLSDYLGRDVTTDPAADEAVDAACAVCRTVAEQAFSETTETVVLDGSGTDALVLSQLPVSQVVSVSVGDEADTDFKLDARGLLVKQTGVWRLGRQNVTVRYKHGYRSTDIPADVKMVARAVAGRLLVQAPMGAMAETVGDVQVRYAAAPTDLTVNELRILRKHRGR